MTNRWLEPTRLSRPYANDRHDPSRGNHPKEGSRFAAPAEHTDTGGAESSARPGATSGKSVRVVPVETGVREPELVGEGPADQDRRLGLVRDPVVTVVQPRPCQSTVAATSPSLVTCTVISDP